MKENQTKQKQTMKRTSLSSCLSVLCLSVSLSVSLSILGDTRDDDDGLRFYVIVIASRISGSTIAVSMYHSLFRIPITSN